MGLSLQKYLVAADDGLYRMADTVFGQMLRDPAAHRLPAFAGQRIRSAELVVHVADRRPVAVVRVAWSVIAFDARGCADVDRLRKQQYARVENALAPVFQGSDRGGKVVDASSQFIAQGGDWMPSVELRKRIEDAALGRRPCARLVTTRAP